MVQFQWHDGTVKNIHVDPPFLYEYQVSDGSGQSEEGGHGKWGREEGTKQAIDSQVPLELSPPLPPAGTWRP